MKIQRNLTGIAVLALVVTVCIASQAYAISTTTTFSGTITDHNGVPLPSGTILIRAMDSSDSVILASGSGSIDSSGQYTVTVPDFIDSYSWIHFEVTYNSETSDQSYGGGAYHAGSSYPGTNLQYTYLYVATPTPTPQVTFNANVKDYATNNPVPGAHVKVKYGEGAGGGVYDGVTDGSGNVALGFTYYGGALEAWVEYGGTSYVHSTWPTTSPGQTINKPWLIDLPATPTPASDTYVITGRLTDNTAGTPVTVSTTYGGGGSAVTDSSGNYRLNLHRGTGPAVLNAVQDYQGWTISRTATIASPNLASGSDTQDFDFFTTMGFYYDFQGTTYVDGVRKNGVHVASDLTGFNSYDSKNYGGNDGFYHIRVGMADTPLPIVLTATYGGVSKQYTINSPAGMATTNTLDIYLTTGTGGPGTPSGQTPGSSSITPTPTVANNTTANNQTYNATPTTNVPSPSQQASPTQPPSSTPATPTKTPFSGTIVTLLAVIGGCALLYRLKK